MPHKRNLPSPLTILMIVVIIAAISTWLLPAGQYSKLAADNNKSFLVTSATGQQSLPFTQRGDRRREKSLECTDGRHVFKR